MQKRSGASINVGASSILVIFVLLCLTTFATLSLLSANADLRLTKKAELASDNYWAACNQAERIIAQIDRSLLEIYEMAGPHEYNQRMNVALASGSLDLAGAEIAPSEEEVLLSIVVPVSDTQELYVELALEDSPRRFRKTAWLLRSTVEWDSLEEPLDLWDGASLTGLPPGVL